MPSEDTTALQNNEDLYKVPFVEHEFSMFKAHRTRSRIVKALIITNVVWFAIVAFIMSKK